MSYSLAILNGDLAQQGDQLLLVWGIDKLKQDLQLWVAERFAGDRFHPTMGSILQDYIGSVISPRTHAEVQDEMLRVLDNYMRVQGEAFSRDPALYSLTELIDSIGDVAVDITFDTVSVSVSVRTAAGTDTLIQASQGM